MARRTTLDIETVEGVSYAFRHRALRHLPDSFVRRWESCPMIAGCAHLHSIRFTELPETIAGCEECLASGSWWVHLRMCQSCRHIGCCDASPNRHASAHARIVGHPIIRSAEPGEDWSYCYVDGITMVLDR